MTPAQTRALAVEILAGIAPDADAGGVGEDQDLRDALDLDSMDFMNFVVALAARTGAEIPEADTPRLRTLRGLATYFAER